MWAYNLTLDLTCELFGYFYLLGNETPTSLVLAHNNIISFREQNYSQRFLLWLAHSQKRGGMYVIHWKSGSNIRRNNFKYNFRYLLFQFFLSLGLCHLSVIVVFT